MWILVCKMTVFVVNQEHIACAAQANIPKCT